MQPEAKQFMRYPSIEPTHNPEQIDTIRKSQFSKPQFIWAALEKIHGSNFSIYCTQNTATYCRRNDFISKPIPFPCENVEPYFIQNFFDCHKLVNTFHNKITDVYRNIKLKYPEMTQFNLFGEYFGGCWPGIVNKQIRPVQLGLYYSPNHHFYIFDCNLNGDKQKWLSVKETIQIVGSILPVVPVHKFGTFEEIFQMNHVFNSTIPNLLGHEIKQKNICEGLILRLYDNPQHILCKKKNNQFLEMTRISVPLHKKQKKQKLMNETLTLISELQNYLNNNRVASAYSKMPDGELFELVEQVVSDVVSDCKKNGVQLIDDQDSLQKVVKTLKRKATSLVSKYLQEVRGYVTKKQKKQKVIIDVLKGAQIINNAKEKNVNLI